MCKRCREFDARPPRFFRIHLGYFRASHLFSFLTVTARIVAFICDVRTPSRAPVSTALCCEDRQDDLAIREIMVDVFGKELFAGLIHALGPDEATFSQLADNIVALQIRVGLRGMGDLKRKAS